MHENIDVEKNHPRMYLETFIALVEDVKKSSAFNGYIIVGHPVLMSWRNKHIIGDLSKSLKFLSIKYKYWSSLKGMFHSFFK